MPRREPDHRWRAIAKAPLRPEHAIEAELWNYQRGLGPDGPAVHAFELYDSPARWCVQGWLLTKAKDDSIANRTGIDATVIKAYRHLFFDVTTFRHHFDLIAWISRLGEDRNVPAEALQYLRWAVMYGEEAIAYLSGLPTYISAQQVQEQTMVNSHFRGLMGRDGEIDGAVAKEALKHQQLAAGQAAVLSKASPPSAGDFAVKLKHREMTSSIEVIDKTTEVLH